MTRVLFVLSSAPIDPNYSGGASRYYQNFLALTSLGYTVHVRRYYVERRFAPVRDYEQRYGASVAQVRDRAASWQDVPYSERVPSTHLGRLWTALARPVRSQFPSVEVLPAILRAAIQETAPDIIWFEGTDLAASAVSGGLQQPWVLSQTDVIHHVRQVRAQRSDAVTRFWLHTLKRAERRILANVPWLVTGSQGDAARSQQLGARRVVVIPAGYTGDVRHIDAAPAPDARIVHLGSLETTANRVGLEAYLRTAHDAVMQAARAVNTPVALTIIGDDSRAKPALKTLIEAAQAECTGFVADLDSALRPFDIAILPYEHDSGYRTKLPLLFNHAQVVVSTRAAIAGSMLPGLEDVCVILERLADFPAAIQHLLAHPDERERLGRAAQQFFHEHLTLDAVTHQYQDLINAILDRQTSGNAN